MPAKRKNTKTNAVRRNRAQPRRQRRSRYAQGNPSRIYRGPPAVTKRTYEVQLGTLTSKGLVAELGPDPELFKGQPYAVDASSYNNYRVLSVMLHFVPLLNQTQAVGMINYYLTTDPQDQLPADDLAMATSTSAHRGGEHFSAYNRRVRLNVPPFKQNFYDTGSGGGTSGSKFEPSVRAFIKPTSLGQNAPDGFALIKAIITVTFSGPALPSLVTSVQNPSDNEIKSDVDYEYHTAQADVYKGLYFSNYRPYVIVQNYTSPKILSSYKVTNDEKSWPPVRAVLDQPGRYTFTLTSDPQNYNPINNYVWVPGTDDTPGEWQEEKISFVKVINPVVLNKKTEIFDGSKIHSNVAESIPIYNKHDDEETPMPVQVVNEKVNVHIEDQPIDVKVTNEKVSVHIEDQPIKVEQQKDAGSEILDLLEDIAVVI